MMGRSWPLWMCFLIFLYTETQLVTACLVPVDLTGPSGNASSPNHPDPYPQEYDCQLITISVTQGSYVRLEFEIFDLGDDDVLRISEPNKTDPLVLRAGGLPKNYYSAGNTLQINFTSESDNTYNNTGFLVFYSETERVLPSPKGPVQSYNLKSGKPTLIRSVNYPQTYDEFSLCFWTVTSSSGTRILAEVMDLDTEESYDFLEWGNGNDATQRFETRMGRLSGRGGRPLPMVSEGNEMWMLFESDYSVGGRGFSVMLYEISLDDPVMKNATAMPNVTCGETVTIPESGSKLIGTPDFPGNYADNLVCEWRVSGVAGLRIRLEPSFFNLEESFDFLDIGNGLDPMDMSSRYLSLTGNVPSDPIMLESDNVWLRFRSDATNSGTGFLLELDQPVADGCGGEFFINNTNPSVTVSVETVLSENTHCQWIIHGRPGHFISGNTTKFSTEGLYDVVEIGTGNNPADPKTRVKMMSGSANGGKFYTPAETVWITFTADGTQSGQGFSMTFTDDACGITTLLDGRGTVQSPGYPNEYPSHADCLWIIQARGGYNVRLTFNDMKTEYGFDKLLIGGLEPQDPGWSPYYELTGDMVMSGDEVLSVYNGVSVRFVSDGTTQDKGFSLSYEETFFCPEGYVLGNNGSACYKFVLTPSSWEEARDECLNVADGDLLVINDQVEFEYIKQMSANISGDWWVGWYDQAVEGQWSWVDCQASTEWANARWANGSRGDSAMEENCGMLLGSSGLLDDRNCSLPMKFVCETTRKGYTYSDAQPSFIRGRATSPSSIRLSWRVSSVICDLRGYQIRYNTTVAMDQHNYINISEPRTSSYEVTGLMADTTYLFEFVIDTFSYGLSSYRTAKSIFATTESSPSDRCPPDYEFVSDGCYKFVRRLEPWSAARQECQTTPGGDLAIVNDDAELMMILNMTGGGDWWIGLNDKSREGRWRWPDCSDITPWQSDRWADGQPDDLNGDQDCAQLLEDGRWNDWNCDRSVQFICEIIQKDFTQEDIVPSNLTAVALSSTAVDLQWIPSTYNCDVLGYIILWMDVTNGNTSMPSQLRVVGGDSRTVEVRDLMPLTTYSFSIAVETEQGNSSFSQEVVVTTLNGTDVSCPEDYQPGYGDNCYKFVKRLVTFEEARADCQRTPGGDLVIIDDEDEQQFIQDRSIDGDWWIGLNDRAVEGRFRWPDCSRLTVWQSSQWAQDQPNDLTGNQDCGQFLETGGWNDWQCDRPMQYICEIIEKNFDPEDVNPRNFAAEELTPFAIRLSWIPPFYDCDVKGYAIMWRRVGDMPQMLQVDGVETAEVRVDNLIPEETYTFQIASETFRQILSFSDARNVTLSAGAGYCPGEYETGPDNSTCYKFVKRLVTWDEARMDCRSVRDGDLVIIDDAAEQDYIMDRIVDGDWWIGFSDRATEGRWQSVNCSYLTPWQASNWAEGQPNDLSETQDCAQLIETGQWNDWQCDRPMQYICEITPKDFVPEEQLATNLTVADTTSTTVTLRWIPPTYSCDVIGYTLTYSSSLLISVLEVEGGDTSEAVVRDLRPLTRYTFTLRTRTTMGDLEPSDPVVADTGPFEGCQDDVPRTDVIGNFTSPLFPDNYPRRVDCLYRIDLSSTAGSDARIRLQFLSFSLIGDDFVRIRELDSSAGNFDNPLVLTGRGPIKDYISFGSSLEIEFVSDAVQEARGFRILYSQFQEVKPGDKACGTTYNIKPNSFFRFESVGYPNGYDNYQSCAWFFASRQGTIVSAFLLQADLEDGYDWLEIGSGSDPKNRTTLIQRITGVVETESFDSEENMMWMTFYTDYSNSGKGFNFLIEAIDPNDVAPPKSLTSHDYSIQATCEENIQVPVDGQAIIESPNYPANYDNDTDCTWLITGIPGRRFQIIFKDFMTERRYDLVTVGSGLVPSDATLYATLSGSSLPDNYNIVLESDTAWIRFTSDGSVNERGFSIAIQNRNDCEDTLTVPSGGNATVMSLNYPSDYPNSTYCFWTIIGELGRPLRADVVSFDTDEGYDYVDVGVGNQPANLSTRFIHVSGSDLQPFSADSSNLWMTFTSDSTVSDKGFQIIFFDDSCDDTVIENTTSGRIESLNYPNTYPNNLDCSWTIRVGDIFRVKLKFEAFNVEAGYDKLIIDGVEGGVSVTLSGSDLPGDIISATNEITIRFQTDSDGGAQGFALMYEEMYYCPDGYDVFRIGDEFTCYKFSADEKTWVDARKDCQSTANADLIIIGSALENRGIANITGGLDWWLGFYDRSFEGIWRWVDCVASTSWGNVNWDNPEGPDSTNGDEDCAVILDSSGRYKAIPCETPRRYICEVGEPKATNGNPLRLTGFGLSTSSIHLDWVLSPQRCDVINYFVQYSSNSGTMEEMTVSNVNTNELDVFDLERDTSYFFSIAALTFTSGRLSYIDPVEIRTLRLDSDFCPLGYQGGYNYECYKFVRIPATWDDARADCRSVENGDLVDINTYAELQYINETAPGETLWIGYYDKGIEGDWRWSDCELPNAWQAVNWAPDAPNDPLGDQDCAELTPDLQWDDQPCNGNVRNGYVCEIYTKNYEDTDQNPLNITAEALTPTKVYLTWVISVRYVCDVLGYNIQYSFDDEKPKMLQVKEAITNRAVVEGLVPNKNYTFTVSAFSSLGDVAPTTSVNFVTPDGDLCPPGYEEGYDYGCYRFVPDLKLWNEARTDCQSTEDGDLLIINDQSELDYITQRKQNITGTWWIGFYDSAEEGVWRWVDCSLPSGLNDTYWDAGQPSDSTGTENCAELTQNSKFSDIACRTQRMYVCEITRKDFLPGDVEPTNFQGLSTTPESVLLRWTVSEYNCDIKGYKVLYRMGPGDELVQTVPGPNTNNVNISGLMPDTEYSFKLLAYTEFGDRDVVGLINVTTQEIITPCPEGGWEPGHDGKCYKFVPELETWYDARAACQRDTDGDLVIIETQSENLYLQERTQGGDWWIGFFDVSVEGDWRWIDCSTPSSWTVSNWGADQPNNLNGNQHCGQILNDGKYNDWQCDRTMQYICEINTRAFDPSDGNPILFRGSADTPNSVSLQWRPSRFSCDVVGYRIQYNNPLVSTFKEVLGGNATRTTITGLRDGFTYAFAIAGFTGEQLLPYSAQINIVTPSLDDLCLEGWEPGLDYKCYKFGLEQKTWEEARADCQSIPDGDLVIIETQEEHSYLVNRTLGGDWWIGFYDQGTEGDWRWLDCQSPSPWAESNWGSNQPNDLDGSQDCGQMLQSGLWNDWNCVRPMQYICEVNTKAFTSDDQRPTLFRGTIVDPTTIQLNWRPSQYNCEVRGYRIVYEENGVGMTEIVEGGATSTVLLKSLIPGTVYVFYIGAFTKDEELDLEGRSVRIQLPLTGICGETDLTAASGTISSPNYPSVYPANQDCIFTISLPDTTASVQIEFMAFDLEQGHDFLMMGPGLTPDVDTQYSLTGTDVPEMVMIDSSQIWIRFFSDESNERSGFSLMYSTAEADLSGESVGSLTIVLISQTFESFNEAVRTEFAIAMANQLNAYCREDENNCLADSSAEFTYKEIRFTSLQDVDEGLRVTFWVSDPNDPTRRQAGLTSSQLQTMLDLSKASLENDGQFQFVVRTETNPLSEPWVIALLCILGVLVLLLLVVIARDLANRSRKKTPGSMSSSDVEMKSRDEFLTADDIELVSNADDASTSSPRVLSAITDNVYYANPVAATSMQTEDDQEPENATGESDDPKGEVGDLQKEVSDPKNDENEYTEAEVEPLYATSSKQSGGTE